MKFSSTIITLAALAGLAASAWAAIPVPSSTLTFDTLPAAADWSTRSMGGASTTFSSTNTITTIPALDAAINGSTNAASTITAALTTSAANPPGTAATAQWSSTGFYIQTDPTGHR